MSLVDVFFLPGMTSPTFAWDAIFADSEEATRRLFLSPTVDIGHYVVIGAYDKDPQGNVQYSLTSISACRALNTVV